MKQKITFEIKQRIAKIERQNESIQLNLMSWGNGETKYDLRRWADDETPLKGISMTKEELKSLLEPLNNLFEPKALIEPESEKTHVIDFRTFLIRDSEFCVMQGHDMEHVKAMVHIVTKFNKVKEIQINATYCKDCKHYYISKFEYNNLKEQGRILCQVATRQQYENYRAGIQRGTLQPESKLHVAGYNVSDGMSQEQRQTILTYVIESGLMEKKEVIGHLSFLIRLNESKKIGALAEWRADRQFLTGYEEGVKRLVGIRYIVTEE